MKLKTFLLACATCALCIVQASALEYSYDGMDDFLFARPTSDDAVYETENVNEDRSKNTALAAPGFGTPTSYLPGSGEYLTPNLVPGALSNRLVNQVGSADYSISEGGVSSGMGGFLPGTSITPPSVGSSAPAGAFSYTTQPNETASVRYTEVTSDSYYKSGTLGTLKIPALNVTAPIYQGTNSAVLKKGVGHFTETSIWDGNVCLASHNRGSTTYFSKLHTLDLGDTITLTTKQGTRTYSVSSVEKVLETDASGTASTAQNQITLYTCVQNQSAYRWCVKGVEKTV